MFPVGIADPALVTAPVRADSPEVTVTSALRDYGVIGDGRTIALVGRNGSIDWLPLPSLNSLPVFAGLLDDESGGRIELAPVGEFTVSRRYVRGTNVLTSLIHTPTGSVRVTDALITGIEGRLPWTELGRRIEGVEGEVRMRWSVQPGTLLGTASPWIHHDGAHSIIHAGSVTIGVTGTEHHPRRRRQPAHSETALHGTFTTAPGSRHILALVATENEPLHLPDAQTVDAGIDRTIATWREWSKTFAFDGRWSSEVQRSALLLKSLVYAPTGAVAAAATTSLPESAYGGKNWDYRFAWVRDAAYSVRALVRFGLRTETHAAFSWLLETIEDDPSDLHVFYDLDGSVPHGVTTFDVPGWNGIGPVVSGNRAQDQRQLGVFGDLLGLAREYVNAGNILDEKTKRMLAGVANRACDFWRTPDSGMWELVEPRHFTSSKMGCWQALDAAVHLAEKGQLHGSPDRWRAERERIRDWIGEHCWSEELGAYTMVAGGTDLDASVLLHAVSGFDTGPRMASTIDTIVAQLGRGPLLYRYSGMDAVEHPFVACSFWLAAALAAVGRQDEAVALMDRLVKLSNDVGVLAEMIDEDQKTFWETSPRVSAIWA